MSNDRIGRQISYSIGKGDLTQDPNEETGADRIGALACADPLGAALWRVLWRHDAGAFKEARSLLAIRLVERNKIGPRSPFLAALCHKAMEEWLVCICDECQGHKFVPSPEGVRATCPTCQGTGKGEHTPAERMRALHCGYREYAMLASVFTAASSILTTADSKVGRQVSKQLER